ncbi:MAG: 2-dehydropantoate 2-reductase N-terminal domain-containing protein [Novosphingobium sp.]|nr:hypothetical protein [Novosphingobium sp.]
MAKSSVLIVGAGALGVVTGYHLHLAGAQVNFLVRPGRLPALQEPQTLYCYDDHELKRFSEYQAYGSVAEAAAGSYDFVIVTMDGATCRGQEATELLRALGDAMQNDHSVALISGVGVRDYCRETMRLPEERVIEGTMGLLSYQTDRVALPLNPPTNPEKLAQASIAYKHMGKNPGFMVVNKPARAAKAFAELYNRSGVSKCSLVGAKLYAMFASSIFAVMAMFDLAGWPDAETMAKDRDLMTLGSAAMKEIMRLPEFGFAGKIASLFISPRQLAKNNAKMEQDCLPVDYSAFNKFHHGGKVREQDIGVLRHSLESGRAQGKSMPALSELLDRYERHIRV